jgi:8-oxo-dGTP pyrophosphatase MutT (NUDIX family)
MSIGSSYLSKLAQAGDMLFANDQHRQYAAICYRRRKTGDGYEVLIVTGRNSGRWVMPRGWPMEGKAPHAVAEREAFEEAGIKGKADKQPLGHYTYAKQVGDGRVVPCLVEVYAVKVEKTLKNYKEHGQRDRRWVSFTEAQNLVEEPELRGLLMNFGASLAQPKPSKRL